MADDQKQKAKENKSGLRFEKTLNLLGGICETSVYSFKNAMKRVYILCFLLAKCIKKMLNLIMPSYGKFGLYAVEITLNRLYFF